MRNKQAKSRHFTKKDLKDHPVSAVRRGQHPYIDLDILQRNLVKNLRPITNIAPEFLKGRTDNFAAKVRAAIASYRGMKAIPKNFNYAVLVVFDPRLAKIGKELNVVKDFRKSVLIPSKRNPRKIHVLNIIEKPTGEISFEQADKKTVFYVLTSATAFYNAGMRKKSIK